MQHLTAPTRTRDIVRGWKLVDVKGKILGRVTNEIAELLEGKGKEYFAKNMDCGDNVVVINAKEVAVTGKKEDEKMYANYSGYPGGHKEKPLWKIRSEKPRELIRHAVWGMLPKNKLRHRMITRLFVYEGDSHPYQKNLDSK